MLCSQGLVSWRVERYGKPREFSNAVKQYSTNSTLLANCVPVVREPEQTREAVRLVRSIPGGERIRLESSGGVTRETVRDYAEAGVDLISFGALPHSAPAVDSSLDVTMESGAVSR